MIFPGTKCNVFPGAIGILLFQLELMKITNLQIVLLHALKISSTAVIIFAEWHLSICNYA